MAFNVVLPKSQLQQFRINIVDNKPDQSSCILKNQNLNISK